MIAPSLAGRAEAVVIGASAGGIEALGKLLPALPPDLRPPVMIVIHLPEERESLLAHIFQAKCRRPVLEAEDKQPILPGHVYFAPPGYHLLVDEGPSLALSVDPLVNFSRPAIDVLFESAAACYGPSLAAILLTGASHDGSSGLDAIRQAGGVTIVQDPADAHTPLMVEAALARTTPDFVLPLSGIAALLSTLDRGNA